MNHEFDRPHGEFNPYRSSHKLTMRPLCFGSAPMLAAAVSVLIRTPRRDRPASGVATAAFPGGW